MSSQEVPIVMHRIMTKTQPNFFRQNNAKVKSANSKLFPDDFFGLPSKDKEDIQQIKKNTQKDHPKLLNPLNPKPRSTMTINEIPEEVAEESVDYSQVRKNNNNLQIIVPPDSSNDEIEPSTAGSSNHKLSGVNFSNFPLIIDEKNKNIFSFSSKINKKEEKNDKNEKKENKLFNKDDNTTIKDEEMFKVTPHFISDNKSSTLGSQEEIKFNRPLTPNTNTFNKAPLTCNNNAFVHYKFNYNYDIKEDDVIVPKQSIPNEKRSETKSIRSKIENHSTNILFTMKPLIQKNENVNENNNNNKINTPRNTSVAPYNRYSISRTDSMRNKITSDKGIALKPKENYNNNKNKKEETSKNNNNNFNKEIRNSNKEKFKRKNQRPNSVCAKNIDYPLKKKNSSESNNSYINNNDLNNHYTNNNNKKAYSKKTPRNKDKNKNMLPYIEDNKLCNVQLKVEQEINNLFRNMPDNEKGPEVRNYYNDLMKKIKGFNADINNKKTQCHFRPRKSNADRNEKKNKI